MIDVKQLAEQAGIVSTDHGGLWFSSHNFQRRVNESDLSRFAALVLAQAAEWYAKEGWLLDEDDVPGAIRALKPGS